MVQVAARELRDVRDADFDVGAAFESGILLIGLAAINKLDLTMAASPP